MNPISQRDNKENPGNQSTASERLKSRSCIGCRRQHIVCVIEADNPPCRRCRNRGSECLFEKPSTGEADLERAWSTEVPVAHIRDAQSIISNTIFELVSQLRGGVLSLGFPPTYPTIHPIPTPATVPQSLTDAQQIPPGAFPTDQPLIIDAHNPRRSPGPIPNPGYQPTVVTPTTRSPSGPGNRLLQNRNHADLGSRVPELTPPSNNHVPAPAIISVVSEDDGQLTSLETIRLTPGLEDQVSSSPNRPGADPEVESGESSASGLGEPWEVLHGPTDVAIEGASKKTWMGTLFGV